MQVLPYRSLLFVPAANARALEKSAGLAADGLIFDLEDSAAPEEKLAARERLRAHLQGGAFAGLRAVRINPLASPWGAEDLLMARGAGVDAILLPKVERPETIAEAAAALDDMDAPAELRLWAMIETPLGILQVGAIAAAGPRLGAFVVGPNDIALASGVKASPDRRELLPWLMQIVLAAKAHGLVALDGVFNDFRNAEGFAVECAAGRRLGFDGKTLIHPAQIEAANRAFAPEAAELREAQAIAAAFAAPENAGKGVIQLGGRMVERLHLEGAERLMARQRAIEARQHGGEETP